MLYSQPGLCQDNQRYSTYAQPKCIPVWKFPCSHRRCDVFLAFITFTNTKFPFPADINTLKQLLASIIDKLRSSGVGALPIHPQVVNRLTDGISHNNQPFSSEEQLMASTTANLRAVYDQLHKSQESASVVANLLTTDYGTRPGAPK